MSACQFSLIPIIQAQLVIDIDGNGELLSIVRPIAIGQRLVFETVYCSWNTDKMEYRFWIDGTQYWIRAEDWKSFTNLTFGIVSDSSIIHKLINSIHGDN